MKVKAYIRASYIVFPFVKTENNNFTKEIKHVFRDFIARSNLGNVYENSRAGENHQLCLGRVFIDLLSNSPKRSPR